MNIEQARELLREEEQNSGPIRDMHALMVAMSMVLSSHAATAPGLLDVADILMDVADDIRADGGEAA